MFRNGHIKWQSANLIVILTASIIFLFSVVEITQGQEISPDQPRSIKWSPEGNQLAVGYENGGLGVYNVSDSSLTFFIDAHNAAILTIDWSPDGSLIATGGAFPDNSLRVWNTSTGNMEYEYLDLGSDVLAIAWKPDGTQIIASAAEPFNRQHSAIVVDRSTWEASPITLGTVSAIDWSPDLTQIAIARISDVRVIDAISFETLNQYALPSEMYRSNLQNQPTGVTWHPNGESFAIAMGDARVFLYEVSVIDPISTFVANDYRGDDRFLGWIHALNFDITGQTLTSISGDGTIRTWDVQAGTLLTEQIGYPNYAADFSPLNVRVALGVVTTDTSQSLNLQAEAIQIPDISVSILVLNPTIASLEELSEQCNVPVTMTERLVQEIEEANSEAIESEITELSNVISEACEADLRALLEAIQNQ
ncbi:MAG: hypothetical protein D6711_19135 [Chloroflexi bacterium]|nr:MAG: hypothetical protein D6711_19135 [Chloroflexota bacterium]